MCRTRLIWVGGTHNPEGLERLPPRLGARLSGREERVEQPWGDSPGIFTSCGTGLDGPRKTVSIP